MAFRAPERVWSEVVQPIRMTWPASSASIAAGINGRRSASLFIGAHKTIIEIFRKAKRVATGLISNGDRTLPVRCL